LTIRTLKITTGTPVRSKVMSCAHISDCGLICFLAGVKSVFRSGPALSVIIRMNKISQRKHTFHKQPRIRDLYLYLLYPLFLDLDKIFWFTVLWAHATLQGNSDGSRQTDVAASKAYFNTNRLSTNRHKAKAMLSN